MEIDTDNLTNKTIRYAIKVYSALRLPDETHVDTSEYNYDEKKILDINAWNTSNVTKMERLFLYTDVKKVFNEDISNWDTSNVVNMMGMFSSCQMFNQNISKWDTSNVMDMSLMFANCTNFNKNISKWDTSQVRTTMGMFRSCVNFTRDISCWNLVNCNEYGYMFYMCRLDESKKPLFRLFRFGETADAYLERYNDKCDNARNRKEFLTYVESSRNFHRKQLQNRGIRSMTPEKPSESEHRKKHENSTKSNVMKRLLIKGFPQHITSFIGPGPINVPERIPSGTFTFSPETPRIPESSPNPSFSFVSDERRGGKSRKKTKKFKYFKKRRIYKRTRKG